MGTAAAPSGQAMYVAPRTDWDWLRSEQCKLYTRSKDHVDYVFRTPQRFHQGDPGAAWTSIGSKYGGLRTYGLESAASLGGVVTPGNTPSSESVTAP